MSEGPRIIWLLARYDECLGAFVSLEAAKAKGQDVMADTFPGTAWFEDKNGEWQLFGYNAQGHAVTHEPVATIERVDLERRSPGERRRS